MESFDLPISVVSDAVFGGQDLARLVLDDQPSYLTSTSVIMPLAACGGPPWRSVTKQKMA